MTKAEFQAAHGPAWARVVGDPSFFAAMQVCSAERLREIENLSAGEIEANGKIHLSNFQGHLKTEAILLELAVEAQGSGFDLPPSDYGAPVGDEKAAPTEPEPLFKPSPKKRPRKK